MASITKIIDSFYNTKAGKWLANPMATAATAAGIATVSNVSKDIVNCAYYTIQSKNNKKIPEEKRPFVAALDLSNGIMNVVTQIATSLVLSKAIMSLFDDHIAKSKEFSIKEDVIKEKYKSLAENMKKSLSEADFADGYKNMIKGRKDLARTGFTVIVVNIAMQILLKRIITPLCATPMASALKKKFEAKEAEKPQQTQKEIAVA